MTRDQGGWKAQFSTQCSRCDGPIVARQTYIVMVKGRAIHIECANGADDE